MNASIALSEAAILSFSLAGIAGSVGIAIADLLMLLSDRQIPMVDRVADVFSKSRSRVFIGGPVTSGLIFPLWAAGLVPVAYALQGSIAGWLAVAGLAVFAYLGAFAHSFFAIQGIAIAQAPQFAGIAEEQYAVVQTEYDRYFQFLLRVVMGSLLLGSVAFSVAVGQGNSLYPPWFAGANPFFWIAVNLSTLYWAPHVFSRWWRPMSVHLFFTPFYVTSLMLLLR